MKNGGCVRINCRCEMVNGCCELINGGYKMKYGRYKMINGKFSGEVFRGYLAYYQCFTLFFMKKFIFWR
jgi:hypothetical protein